MRNSKVFLGRVALLFPLFTGTITVLAAQSEGTGQSIFHYAVSNQIVAKNQKQNLFSVLKDLNKTRGVFFLFSDSSIANKQVAVPDMNGFIEDILGELLKNTGLKYKKISKNTFVITSDKVTTEKSSDGNLYNLIETPYGELRFASVNSAYYAPPRKIIGKIVSSKDGKPLEGVSVKVKGQKIGTTTKSDGSFTLDVPENATLEFSAIGYLTTTSKPTASGIVSVTLQESASDLEDVVVVAYGTQKRSTFTGAATIINNQMIEDVPRASFQESLQGNAVGVLSTSGTGQPGSTPDIRIRGVGSITASSAPLYVVDGIPLVSGDISNGLGSNTIAALNPLDIQSTVILKDAAATALYGSRGANGVILITTRKGKAGKTVLDCRLQTGISYFTLKNSKDRTASTTQMIEYLREGWKNAGNDPNQFSAQLAQIGIDSTINTDWFKQVLRQGNYANASLNASGGNEKTTFYVSGGLFQIDGVQNATSYKKITTLINVTHRASDRFTLNAGISGAYQLSNSSVIGATFMNPTRAMYRLQDWLTPTNPDGTYRTDFNSGYNPVAIQKFDLRRTTTYILRGTANGVYRLGRGLTYESTIGLDYSHAFNLIYNDPRYGNDNVAQNGSISNFTGDIANWIWTNIIRYKRTINVDNSFEVFGGYEASKRTDNTVSVTAYNLPEIGMYSISNAAIPLQPTAIIQQEALVSQFLNGSYSFRNKIYASASIRNDDQSRFAIGNKNGQFWSIGAGYDISKEKFFRVPQIVSLKLRASYGKTGNSIGLPDYAWQGLYGLNSSYGDEAGISFKQLQNSGFTWEKNYPLNIGFDVSLFKNRVAASFDWYTRKTTDLLMSFPLSGVTGLTVSSGNYGTMRNTGFEIIFNTVNIVPKTATGFRWATQINFTTNQNTILQLVRNTTGTYDRHPGTDYYQWYTSTYGGVDSATGQALWVTGYDSTGKAKTTNSYSTALKHLSDQGSALPKFFGGITNSFSYRHFSLLVMLFYNYGNKIYDNNGVFNSSDGSTGFSSTGNIPLYDYNHRWQKPGDITTVPAPVYLGTQTGISNMNSTRFLYDGSYIRLRDVMLSYDFPARILSKAKITTTKVYLRANNLYTLVKDKRLIYDPQTNVDGQINLQPPQQVTILLGANIVF